MAKRGHNGHGYRTIWDAILVKPDLIICWLCNEVIDQRLKAPHGMSKSLDMVVPHALGGDPSDPHNYRPAHLDCNKSRGARSPEEFRARQRLRVKGCNSSRGAGDKPARQWIVDDSP